MIGIIRVLALLLCSVSVKLIGAYKFNRMIYTNKLNSQQRCRSLVLRSLVEESKVEITDKELTKIFGRLADKKLLLDIEGAGTPEMVNCCHGGCDNCDFSHVFDNLNAGRPKWIALYPTGTRELIDGRSHDAAWVNLFDAVEYGDKLGLMKEEFVQGVMALPYQNCLGPPSSVPADELPSPASLEIMWDRLMMEAKRLELDANDVLTAEMMTMAMKSLSGEDHGAKWKDFKRIFDQTS
mmetsp:Transcript_3036/g.4732  ORF Transcript_3036/g.4732 Transcript_3036/m.4732 type:complete len:238 (-) Transcript_3036:1879-2592(-)